MVELLSLIKACQIAKERGHKELQVFEDSEILIKKIYLKGKFNDARLNKNLQRLRYILQEFTSFKCFHILRESNKEVDTYANKGRLLVQGDLSINDGTPAQSAYHECNSACKRDMSVVCTKGYSGLGPT